ncbi:MAG: hypothetical protein EOP47_30575 [Sphingobacteriaceae bacterium]|nr:MAG: hypothetical protein EOP47_30575 [Sphingobacteriaceae bacterium]
MNIPYILTLSYSWTRLAISQNAIFLIIMIPLTILLAIKYGGLGGALSWAIINTLYIFITPYLIHRKLLKGELRRWYWEDTIRPVAGCLAVILPVRYFIRFDQTNGLTNLLIIGLTGLAAVGASFLLANNLRNNTFAAKTSKS